MGKRTNPTPVKQYLRFEAGLEWCWPFAPGMRRQHKIPPRRPTPRHISLAIRPQLVKSKTRVLGGTIHE